MSTFENLTARSRYFRVLLYTDNPDHMRAFDFIKCNWGDSYIGIVHKAQEDEKEHIHIVLSFVNPRQTAAVCRSLGFVDATDLPNDQFVRAICKQQKRKVLQQYKSCCIYLTHRNAPEKEQYPVSDLFGFDDIISWTKRQVVKYESQECDMSDSVLAVLDWIEVQDGAIRVQSFGKWLCNSPYFKANNNKIVWAALREHNLKAFNNKDWVPENGFDTLDDFREMTDDEMRGLAGLGFVFGGD